MDIRYGSLREIFPFTLGPAVGAWLYGIGGFMLPFISVSSVCLILASLLIVTIPSCLLEDKNHDAETKPLVDQTPCHLNLSSAKTLKSNDPAKLG